ncbi:MAG: aminotransferase class I/II-fold pyridoxal phosphate-dependent enzyme [bacterium]|nr:aminotransferase class I/II-fold pyridoxal phosphate-dependent enzyme [bacterium]
MARRTPLDLLDSFVSTTATAGLVHCSAEDTALQGRTIRIKGRDLLQFGSCSYLGLELDPRLSRAACEAAERFGTQFSSSRSYVSAPLYTALEERLEEMLGGATLVTPTTTLGHLAALPSLVHEDDALLLDHQVHHSVQMGVQVARSEGCHVELVPHNDLDGLEERATALSRSHRRVWILADGVYSMFGDLAPVEALWAIAERVPNLWLYIDDAHGMGWCGPRGCGSVLSRVPLHERVVVATSLNKSFAAAGGCLVFGDSEQRRRVRTVGGPMIFSGPVQPPMLGVGLASAEIHLSEELPGLQAELASRIALSTRLLEERGLPIVSKDPTPIRFVGVGLPRVARNLAARLMADGFYTNVSHFPAVPMKQAGIRFTITRHHRPSDLEALAEAIDRNFDAAFREEGQDSAKVWSTFHLDRCARTTPRSHAPTSEIEELDSIEQIDRETWDACLGGRGSFDWEGLRFLERVFRQSGKPEDEWRFRYYMNRDPDGTPVLATFFTQALWKLDMMEDAATSDAVEALRQKDPYMLTAPVYSMGSLLTEGNHLFVDPNRLPPGSPGWEKQLSALLTRIREAAEAKSASFIALRDLPTEDERLEGFLGNHGFVRQDAPERFALGLELGKAEQLRALRKKYRAFLRTEVAPWNDAYHCEIASTHTRPLSNDERARIEQLYQNVQGRSRELNTFPLPAGIFEAMLEEENWELLLLRAATEPTGAPPLAMVASYRGRGVYCPMVIGLDYEHVRSAGLYRQCLRHVILRGRELKTKRIALGMGAGLQKKRFGARAEAASVYMLAEDHFALDVLSEIWTRTRQ